MVERDLGGDNRGDKTRNQAQLSPLKRKGTQHQVVPPLVPPQNLVLNWEVPQKGRIRHISPRARSNQKSGNQERRMKGQLIHESWRCPIGKDLLDFIEIPKVFAGLRYP